MTTNYNKQKAFTLIELLVVVAVIGLLASVIGVSFGNVRLRARDTKRLSDMGQVKTGLDLYYTSAGGYPDTTMWNTGGLTCKNTRFMDVPKDPLLGAYYEYYTNSSTIGCNNVTVWKNYYVQFTTEGETDLGPAGTYFLTTKGYATAAPF
jgi:prepilin-type N-terminal cleavage/methylation domain-containing protein